jgi:hypothetical protein
MDKLQKEFEAWVESEFRTWAIQSRPGVYGSEQIQDMWKAWQAALSANGGEPPTWTAEDEPVAYLTWHQVRHAIDDYEDVVALSHKDDRSADGTPAFPVYTHPAPPSVAVPDAVEKALKCFDLARFEGWDSALAEGNSPALRDIYKRRISWAEKYLQEMLTAAPSPDHSGDANKVVDDLPGMWDQSDLSGGETDADHIADAGKVSFVDGLGAQRMTAEECKEGIEYIIHGDNIYWPLSDDDELRLIQAACGNGEFTYPQATPSVPENDNGVSSAYDSGYLDAMLYARVCCDRLDNPENTKDYRDCARFLDLIFKSEIDEAARLRAAGDEGEGYE